MLREAPGADAVEFQERWFTRHELRALCDRIEELLAHANVGQGAPVGLVVRNDPAHLAALFGLMARRRPVVVISPFQDAARLAGEVTSLGLGALLADAADWSAPVHQSARAAGSVGLRLASRGSLAASLVEGLEWLGRDRGDVKADYAIQLLTSGTSGVPKRVPFSHATIDQAIAHQIELARDMGETADTMLIQYAPMASISGAWNALQMAYEGRRMVMLEKFSVPEWHRAVKLYRPSFVALPPTMLRMVMDANLPKADFSSIRSIRVGSAPIDDDTKHRFEDEYGIPLLLIYGATEYAGPFAAWSLDDHARYRNAKAGSTGHIRRHMAQVRIVSDSGTELPRGEMGRLEVQLPRVGPAWISTNDLASVDEDDFLYIHGRADDAIIRGGFKIPPDTIADALRRHPAVLDVAVIAIPDARLGQVPVAAVQLKHGAEPVDEAALAQFARQTLIAYQVPVAFRIVQTLPRTELGKVFRPGLQALFADLTRKG